MEETRCLLQGNRKEPTALIVQRKLEEEQSEEGNYSRNVSQAEPQVVRSNNPDVRIERNGCKYKEFMVAKPPSLSKNAKPVENSRLGLRDAKWCLIVVIVVTERKPF